MDGGILAQIFAACQQAEELGNAVRLAADPGYLLNSCDELAAAFHQAAASLRSQMLLPEVPPPEEHQRGAIGPLIFPPGAELMPELAAGPSGSRAPRKRFVEFKLPCRLFFVYSMR